MGEYKRTWSRGEDMDLTNAIESVFIDLGKPKKLKSDATFWKRVHDKIMDENPGFMRTASGVRNRWDHIKADADPEIAKVISFRYQRRNVIPNVPTADQMPLAVDGEDERGDRPPLAVYKAEQPTPVKQLKTPEIAALCRGITRTAENLGVTTDDVVETIIDMIGAQQ